MPTSLLPNLAGDARILTAPPVDVSGGGPRRSPGTDLLGPGGREGRRTGGSVAACDTPATG